jgi:hypothetical protein
MVSIAESNGAPPVRCALSKSTTMALEKWCRKLRMPKALKLNPTRLIHWCTLRAVGQEFFCAATLSKPSRFETP